MSGEQIHRSPGVLLRCEPQAHLGRGDRDELVRGLDHTRGVQAEHGDGRLGPQPLRDRPRADQGDAGSQRGVLPVLLLGQLQALPGTVGQALDRDLPVVVVQGGQDPRERRDRVDRGSAVGPAVHRQVERPHRDDAVDDAADARLERGDPGSPVPTVGHADHVGYEELPVPADQEGEVLGAGLLLALDQDLDGDRRLALPCPHRGSVHDDAALVVGGAPPVEAAVANLGFERRAGPLLVRSLGLHVVVRVQQHRRRAGGTRDLAEHGRVVDVGELDRAGRHRTPRPRASRRSPRRTRARACRRTRGTRSTGCGRGSTAPR